MTSKERMASAMAMRIADRVPVMCQMSIGHMLVQTGRSPVEFWHSEESFAAGLLELRARYGFDGILVSLYGHKADWDAEVSRIAGGPAGQWVTWKNGQKTFYPCDDLPVPDPAAAPAFPDFAGFDPDSLPPAISYIPVSQGLRFPLDPERLFIIFDRINAAAGRDYSIHGEVTSPLDYFLDLFGFEQALAGLVDDEARASAILDRLTDALVPLAVGMVKRGADAVKISSPYAGAGFLSPAFYRTYVLPFEGRIAAAVRSAGAPAYLHTCGNIDDRLEIMARSGASGIECLDPPPLGRVDLADAKRRVGRMIFIKGNIDPVHTLLAGNIERVREDARMRTDLGMPGGGYILSTACSIAPRTPAENIVVLGEVAATRGVYR